MRIPAKLNNSLLMLMLFTYLVGCSSKPIVQDYPIGTNPSTEISNLEDDLKMAKSNQIDILTRKFQGSQFCLGRCQKDAKQGQGFEQNSSSISIESSLLG